MIVSDNKRAFNSRITKIISNNFYCMITTAKQGIFKGLSTHFYDRQSPRACAKLIYSPSLNSDERHNIHSIIVYEVDAGGERGEPLTVILNSLFSDLKSRGIVSEAHVDWL